MAVKTAVCVRLDAVTLRVEPVCMLFCTTVLVAVKLGLTTAVASAETVLDPAWVIAFAAARV